MVDKSPDSEVQPVLSGCQESWIGGPSGLRGGGHRIKVVAGANGIFLSMFLHLMMTVSPSGILNKLLNLVVVVIVLSRPDSFRACRVLRENLTESRQRAKYQSSALELSEGHLF
jgi:hypothetical protein